MKKIPQTENAPVLRTDFSNQTAWEKICVEILKPVRVSIFRAGANVSFIDDVEFADITKEQLLKAIPSDYNHTFIIVVDHRAIAQPDHPLLIINLFEMSGNEFRAIPSKIQGIENNLSIANMDFEDFARHVDSNGVFRGFPKN